jgi:hypothetical protein
LVQSNVVLTFFPILYRHENGLHHFCFSHWAWLALVGAGPAKRTNGQVQNMNYCQPCLLHQSPDTAILAHVQARTTNGQVQNMLLTLHMSRNFSSTTVSNKKQQRGRCALAGHLLYAGTPSPPADHLPRPRRSLPDDRGAKRSDARRAVPPTRWQSWNEEERHEVAVQLRPKDWEAVAELRPTVELRRGSGPKGENPGSNAGWGLVFLSSRLGIMLGRGAGRWG